jgi:hypothetical protein
MLLVVARVEPRRADHEPAAQRRRGAHHHGHASRPVLHLQHRPPGAIGAEAQREVGGAGDRILRRAAHHTPRPVEQQLVLLSALARVRTFGAHFERLEVDRQAVVQEVERPALLLVQHQQVRGRPLRRLERLPDPAVMTGRVEPDDHAVEARRDLVDPVEGALREALEPPAVAVAAQEARHVVSRAVQHLRLALHERDGKPGRIQQ